VLRDVIKQLPVHSLPQSHFEYQRFIARDIYNRLPVLLCSDVFQFLIGPQEIVRVSLWDDFATIRFLDEVLVTLLLRKSDRIVLRFEVQMCSLHEITRRLPSHQRILPPMALRQDVPVHTPVVSMPISRLCWCLCWFINAVKKSDQTESEFWYILTYRTVLASSSIGAPDSTAAGKTSPSSLPFITRLGIGVKSL
jgi:hypothetical protein